MNIAILGFGAQGKSALEYWHSSENSITVCDKNETIVVPEGINTKLGADHLRELDAFDLIVRSPFVHPRDIVNANNSDILRKVTTNTNEFFRVCPTKNIVGVTGTKGKGTTSTLIANMLQSAGKRTYLGGNIGIPPLELLKQDIQPDDWVVLELANFQLIDLVYSPHVAVCVAVVEEHLDWHNDIQEYIEAKQQLFRWQKSDDFAIYYPANDNSKTITSVSSGAKIPYLEAPGALVHGDHIEIDGTEICRTGEIALPGKHNWQNVCAAVTAVWQITQDTAAIREGILGTKSLPFRIEARGQVNDITFYNDSFATAPSATIAAIEAIHAPKVLILGGFERNLDLADLAHVIKEHSHDIRKIVLIGESASRLQGALEDAGYTNTAFEESKDMAAIVRTAYGFARSGDAVVLSPAFASFDMFKNFEERGKRFNEAIETL